MFYMFNITIYALKLQKPRLDFHWNRCSQRKMAKTNALKMNQCYAHIRLFNLSTCEHFLGVIKSFYVAEWVLRVNGWCQRVHPLVYYLWDIVIDFQDKLKVQDPMSNFQYSIS